MKESETVKVDCFCENPSVLVGLDSESVEGCVEPLERILPNGEKHKTSKRMSNAI
jgi:hypothetical protein